ncbi:MAG: DNA translocase FtsK [Saprospiraceae bacterium]|nr:DNA translocase FtsK [Saprospiraceae bacterium]
MARKTRKKSKKKGSFLTPSDDRFRKITGILCIFLSLYLFIAFISYLFTWQFDQDKVLHLSSAILFNGDVHVQNWLGRLGAYTSHLFYYWGFGISSFFIVYLTAKLGISLIRKSSLVLFVNEVMHSIVLMSFISVVLEFVFRNAPFSWGGLMGYSIYAYLGSFLGQIGLVLFFILLIASGIIWIFNPQLNLEPIKLTTGFENLTLPKWDFKISTEGLKDKFVAPQTASKQRPKLFEDLEGAIPKTDSKDEGSQFDASPQSSIELNLPDSLPQKSPHTKASAADGEPQLELELEAPTPQTGRPDSESSNVKKGIGPDMDSDKTYVEVENREDFEPYDPTKELSRYEFPTYDLLTDYSDSRMEINREELEENKNQIIKTLLNYNIKITKIKATIGPTVTLYEIVPAPGVKISSIKKLEDDIALSLAALGIRIIAPIPGKGTVGIEVPNKNKQIVSFKEVVQTDKFRNAKMDLPIVLGKTISNEVFVADLAKMPHLLIAGATGQGKSVGINTILMSLLYKKHPSQVKLVMIDPKKVELFPYSYLDKHFLGFLPNEEETIVTDTKKVITTLNSLTAEMDERYDLLKAARARNIKEYNAKFVARKLKPKDGHRFLPFIVLVIDEFADLIMTAGKEIELPIARLAQLARAIGIHLIIATQRPSVKIITGMIKANFPARIAFKVTSQIDSRTILDSKGAEQLIGKGDMLLSVGSDIIRLQCAFVDTPEVENAIQHISDQQGFAEPFHLPEVMDENGEIGGSNLTWAELDPMFEEAARLVVGSQHGSTSMIQRKLQLGYNRAGRIVDQMESLGIVGEANGSKPRQVLFTSEMELIHYLEHLKKQN